MNRAPASLIILLFSFLFTQSGYAQLDKKTVQGSPIYNGSTDVKNVYSPALEGNLQGNPATQPVKVYLPPEYDKFPDNKYPVVYLLHGYTQGHNAFYDYGILNKLNALISSKTIVPIIIVTPNANTVYDGSFYTNSYVSGNWEDYIIQDVIEHTESNYRVLDKSESRGLSGFSMGGYGAAQIGMKHPSIYKSICLMGGALLDFEEMFLNPPWKEDLIYAAKINNYRPDEPWNIRVLFAAAVAFAPDSTAKPTLGRLPFTVDSILIDSIWQKWLQHDPVTMLQSYEDSLLKLNAIQMYIGNQDDLLPINETFHQALLDYGIDHGYKTYPAGHDPRPILEDLLIYFSESLEGAVPTVKALNEYYYMDGTDILVFKTNMNGKLYFVPDTVYPAHDSIIKYKSTSVEVIADEKKEINLSEFEFGNYLVYGISNENMVSNIPEGFGVVDYVPEVIVQVIDSYTMENLSGCSVYLNGNRFVKESEEVLSLTGWAYDTCSLKITKGSYVDFDTTVVLKSDTTLVINLKYAYPEPALAVYNNPLLDKTDYLEMKLSQHGKIYLTPEGTPAVADSITEYAIDSFYARAEEKVFKLLQFIPPGIYRIYGISNAGRIATNSYVVQVIDHFPECIVQVKDAVSKDFIDSCLMVIDVQDTIPGTQGEFDLTGYYDTCSIAVFREGYGDFDTTLVVLSDTIFTIYLESLTATNERLVPQIRIFPNPTNTILTIETNQPGYHSIEISSLNGQLINSGMIEGTIHQLDLSSYQKGVYFITIRSKDFVTTRKIIKL